MGYLFQDVLRVALRKFQVTSRCELKIFPSINSFCLGIMIFFLSLLACILNVSSTHRFQFLRQETKWLRQSSTFQVICGFAYKLFCQYANEICSIPN